jgi:hypothetical protein
MKRQQLDANVYSEWHLSNLTQASLSRLVEIPSTHTGMRIVVGKHNQCQPYHCFDTFGRLSATYSMDMQQFKGRHGSGLVIVGQIWIPQMPYVLVSSTDSA